MDEKTYNAPKGFLCPNCKKAFIKLNLYSFLYETDVCCPVCGTKFSMDKSQCASTVEKLQDLYLASQEVEKLKNQRL